MVGFSTYFDRCEFTRDGDINENVMSCINFMGQIDKNIVYSDKFSICEYHYCSILKDRQSGRHNTLSCSGGILRLGDDNQFFNPITPFKIKFDEMVRMPMSSVELMAAELEYYYAKDIRTSFSEDIIDLNCTNDFKTCIQFNNGTLCFGNTFDQKLVGSREALVWGSMTSLVVGAFVIFVLMPRFKNRGMFYMLFTYLLPLAGIIFLYAGLVLGPKIPFIMSSVMVFLLFPILYYSLRDFSEQSNPYQQVSGDDGDEKNIKGMF